jgi:hypothetical protein
MFVHAKLLGILVEATSRKRINKKDFKNQQSCTVFRDYLIHFVQQMHKNNCNLTFHNWRVHYVWANANQTQVYTLV